MLPVIQSLWIGKPLSNLEKLCIKSFMDHGHEFHIYTYADIGGIPEGAVVKNGNEILPQSTIYRQGGGHSLGSFSNWFRYALLYKRGGYWVDMDVVCIKPFDFAEDIVFGMSADAYLNGAVMAFPVGHEVMRMLDNACRNHNDDMPWDDASTLRHKAKRLRAGANRTGFVYGETGTRAFNNIINHTNRMSMAKPFTVFYPIGFKAWIHSFDRSFPDGADLYPSTYAVHLWNEVLRHVADFDKNARFDDASLFEQLKAMHGIETDPDASVITHDNIVSMGEAEIQKQRGNARATVRRRRNRTMIVYLMLLVALAISIFVLW